jgi:hypothetical protein
MAVGDGLVEGSWCWSELQRSCQAEVVSCGNGEHRRGWVLVLPVNRRSRGRRWRGCLDREAEARGGGCVGRSNQKKNVAMVMVSCRPEQVWGSVLDGRPWVVVGLAID